MKTTLLYFLTLTALSATEFEVEIPILIQCTATEEAIAGSIQIEEKLSKWTVKTTSVGGGPYYYFGIFDLYSNKSIQISFNNNTYKSAKPNFHMRVESKSAFNKALTISEIEKESFFMFYKDFSTLSLSNSKTGFEIKLSTKHIQSLHEGIIKFNHYGVEASCPYRVNTEAEPQLSSDTIPSLLPKP